VEHTTDSCTEGSPTIKPIQMRVSPVANGAATDTISVCNGTIDPANFIYSTTYKVILGGSQIADMAGDLVTFTKIAASDRPEDYALSGLDDDFTMQLLPDSDHNMLAGHSIDSGCDAVFHRVTS